MKKIYLVSFIIFSFFLNESFSQKQSENDQLGEFEVEVTEAQFLGKTPPLRNLVPLQSTSVEKREAAEKLKKEVPNFMGRKLRSDKINPRALPQGEDPIIQNNLSRGAGIPVEPIVNIDGMDQSDASNVNPPDVCGEMGMDVYVQMVNASSFQVFDKEGNSISNPISTNTIWSQVGMNSAGDPIILYDQEVDRWIITEFPFGNILLFAVSETSDPLGSWMAWAFSTPQFPDYPKYSIWPNAYCVTTNEQGAGTLVNYFINREEILDGETNPTIQRITLPGVTGGPGFFVSTPVDWTGEEAPPADAKPMILKLDDDLWGSVDEDGITVFEMDIDWDDEANTTAEEIFVPSAPFNTAACAAPGAGFACIPQLDGNGIDGIPDIIMHQIHYRNFGSHESMVLNFLVNSDGIPIRSGIRWMELRRTDGSDWSVYQEGTYSPADGLHRFMGGIAMDGSGNIGLGFSFSSPNHYPGLGFTGRKASDPLGTMTIDEFIITEGFSSNPGDRYGDYAQMVVDPANDRTFWYTGEYRQNNGWGTKIFAFEIGRDTTDLSPTALQDPISSPDLTALETVSVEVKNLGLDTITEFEIGFVFENESPVIESINATLLPDEIYTHIFTPTVDMSVVGDYDFTLFTNIDMDDAPLNDTLRVVRSKLPRFDAGVIDIEGLDGLLCGTELPATLVFQNFGTEAITSLIVETIVNGGAPQINTWNGDLAPGESTELMVTVTDIIEGTNTISATASMPNGMPDEIPANDTFSREFEAVTDGIQVSLELLTDFYPEETTWELVDENGTTIDVGGPYFDEATLVTVDWCLAPDACYVFTIFDSANDGICCGFGEGNYTIVDSGGNPLISSTGQFGSSESMQFCLGVGCQMTADISISPETEAGASDGSILIETMNGVGPFMYSIDGGVTFQSENVFDNLPAGDYDIVVTGLGDCLYEETISLIACAISFTAITTPESNSNSEDGQIEIEANGGNGEFSYSIDGGVNFQTSPIFQNLGTGNYEVVVLDDAGCSANATVLVDIKTSFEEVFEPIELSASPNPTDGIFQVRVKGLKRIQPLLQVRVYDASGKLIQDSFIGRFNNEFKGEISLSEYPAGTYFVKFIDEKINEMLKVSKH